MSTVAVTTSPRRGFDSLQDEVRVERLEIRGALPEWLTGSLIRTGPALWDLPGQSMNHWFDGMAMLHRRAGSPTRSSPPTRAARCFSA
jgi:carotenoid cleavage dioxygenase-like enzyme